MKIISPITLDFSDIQSSNIVENDAPLWSPGTYNQGDQVIFNHRVYEAQQTTTDQPDQGALADPQTWIDLGATNLTRIYDAVIGNPATRSGSVEYTLRPRQVVNAAGLFGVKGTTARVRMIDATEGVVYDETRPLLNNDDIASWHSYYFALVRPRNEVVFDGLPNYRNADIEITIDAGTGTAELGEVTMGRTIELGVTLFGTTPGIRDFSRKERDPFGTFQVVERKFAKTLTFEVSVDTARVNAVLNTLAEVRAKPTVYIGNEDQPATVIFGFFNDFVIPLSNPLESRMSLKVEGIT